MTFLELERDLHTLARAQIIRKLRIAATLLL